MTSKSDASVARGNNGLQSEEAHRVLRERARQAISHQPARTVTILSSLLAAHDELGWLPEEAVDEVSARTGASPNTVWGVASFYPNFRFKPPNRHKIELCWGPTCHVLGAQQLLQRLLPALGLDNEGDTADGVISLKLNTCLGVCAHGPAMSFDDELTGHVDLDRAVRIVERLRIEDEEAQRAQQVEDEAQQSQAEVRARSAASHTGRYAPKPEDTTPPVERPVENKPAMDPGSSAEVHRGRHEEHEDD